MLYFAIFLYIYMYEENVTIMEKDISLTLTVLPEAELKIIYDENCAVYYINADIFIDFKINEHPLKLTEDMLKLLIKNDIELQDSFAEELTIAEKHLCDEIKAYHDERKMGNSFNSETEIKITYYPNRINIGICTEEAKQHINDKLTEWFLSLTKKGKNKNDSN